MTALESILATLRSRAFDLGYNSPKQLVKRSPMTLKWLREGCEQNGLDPRELIDHWHFTARHNQMTPDGDWDVWLMLTGRGFGKSEAASRFMHAIAKRYPGKTFCIAGRTKEDVRKTTVQSSESGLLVTQDPDNPCEYKHHYSEVRWANGSVGHLLTSEEPDGCRGPGYAGGIIDELATWKTKKDSRGNTLWMNIQFAVRAKLPDGAPARLVAGTTPVPSHLISELEKEGMSGAGTVHLTRGTMYDNRENLGAGFIRKIERKYKGTHLFDQEALGIVLTSVEGAILTREKLEASRVETLEECPEFERIAVGADPAVTSTKRSDDSGINVSGLGVDGHVYSLADRTLKASPDNVIRAIVDAYWEFDHLGRGPSVVQVETNNGGDYLTREFESYPADQRPRVAGVWASKSKGMRFKDICGWWERGEGHFVGREQKELESQYCGFTMDGLWVGDGSPDNADAAVHAQRELLLGNEVDWEELLEANRA